MGKRKVTFDDDDDDGDVEDNSKNNTNRTIRKPIKRLCFETLPPINNLKDLITVAKTYKYYKNIDNLILWDILPHLEELDSMIGLDKVKETVFFQIIYYLQNLHKRNIDGEYLHTMITGKPGCGKSSISRIIANIYHKLKILGKGTFKSAHREDFIGQYLGETTQKTKKVLSSCIGGVLFVDEIYALGPGQKDKDSYSKEAIDTINVFLSEHKNDFCFIAAGYKEDIIKCFFSVNKGLERRFAWIHHIEDYTEKNLYDILMKMIKDANWTVTVDEEFLLHIIKENKELFSNAGGSCENYFTKCKLSHSKRVFGLDDNVKFILTEKDMMDGLDMLKNLKLNTEKKVNYDYYT
jgi:SpoVK/Ycf46/Vps4 family AAA+-type ATPase